MARFGNLNPYDLHKRLINDYILKKPGDTKLLQRDTSKDRTDYDVIRENHRFLWDDDELDSWEKQLAKRYYDKLFKEYCICDLSRYKDNKVILRYGQSDRQFISSFQFIFRLRCGGVWKKKLLPAKDSSSVEIECVLTMQHLEAGKSILRMTNMVPGKMH